MLIIMLAGKAGAGKDTVADIITKNIPRSKKFAFADDLKLIAKALDWDGKKDERGRLLLQQLGALGRSYNKDVWVNQVMWKIEDELLDTNNNVFVISDFRFPNEYGVLHRRYGDDVLTINIVGRQADIGKIAAKDSSENSLTGFKFDYVVENTGTIDELGHKVLSLLGGTYVQIHN